MVVAAVASGNREDHEPFNRPLLDRSALRSNNYGYSRMHVYNATHMYWEQVMCDSGKESQEGQVIDSVWLIQHAHGPFGNQTREVTAEAARRNRNVVDE